MIAKKFALAIGIAIVFPAMIHFGVRMFSTEPKWKDYGVDQEAEYQAAEKIFEKHLFDAAVPLGLITMIVGAFLPRPAIGTGLMFGSIFSLCDGYFNSWTDLSAQLKFFSLLAAFIVLLAVGYRKLEKKET